MAAVVADEQEPRFRRCPEEGDTFGIESSETVVIDLSRCGRPAVPAVEAGGTTAAAAPGEDEILAARPGEVADPEAVEIEQPRLAEPRRLARHRLGRVQQRHQERLVLRDRAAETDQQPAVRHRCEALDVQSAFGLRRPAGRLGQPEARQLRRRDHRFEQARAGLPDRREREAVGALAQPRRDEALPGRTIPAVLVAAVRTHPVDDVADPGGAFDVPVRLAVRGREPRSHVEPRQRPARGIGAVELQHVVVVAPGEEQVLAHRHRRRGVGHARVDAHAMLGARHGETEQHQRQGPVAAGHRGERHIGTVLPSGRSVKARHHH